MTKYDTNDKKHRIIKSIINELYGGYNNPKQMAVFRGIVDDIYYDIEDPSGMQKDDSNDTYEENARIVKNAVENYESDKKQHSKGVLGEYKDVVKEYISEPSNEINKSRLDKMKVLLARHIEKKVGLMNGFLHKDVEYSYDYWTEEPMNYDEELEWQWLESHGEKCGRMTSKFINMPLIDFFIHYTFNGQSLESGHIPRGVSESSVNALMDKLTKVKDYLDCHKLTLSDELNYIHFTECDKNDCPTKLDRNVLEFQTLEQNDDEKVKKIGKIKISLKKGGN